MLIFIPVYTFYRTGRVGKTVPTVLVQVCRHFSEVGLLCTMDHIKEMGVPYCDGPFRGFGHHYLHRTQHCVHGHGTLSNDTAVRICLVCGEFGKALHTDLNDMSLLYSTCAF